MFTGVACESRLIIGIAIALCLSICRGALPETQEEGVNCEAKELLRTYTMSLVDDTRDIGVEEEIIKAGGNCISEIAEFMTARDARVRRIAFGLCRSIGMRSEVMDTRRRATSTLVGFLDRYALTPDYDEILGKLLSFRSTDFDEASKRELVRQFESCCKIPEIVEGESLVRLVKVLGYAGIREIAPEIESIYLGECGSLQHPSMLIDSVSCMCLLTTLARLEYKDYGNVLVETVRRDYEESKDIYRIRYLEESACREAAEYLIPLVYSDELEAYAGDDVVRFPISQHAIKALAAFVKGLPVRKEAVFVSDEEMANCRKWLKEHKEIELVK